MVSYSWRLAVLEAMATGTPVITYRRSERLSAGLRGKKSPQDNFLFVRDEHGT